MVVRVGVGCFLFNSKGDFITGIRKGSHGSGSILSLLSSPLYMSTLIHSVIGSIQLPGGHLEVGETFERCAMREVEEETGISIFKEEKEIKFVTATNDVFSTTKHYVTIFVACRVGDEVEPKVSERERSFLRRTHFRRSLSLTSLHSTS